MYPTESSMYHTPQPTPLFPPFRSAPPPPYQTPFAATFHERQTAFTIVPHPQYQALQPPSFPLPNSLLVPSSISSHSGDPSPTELGPPPSPLPWPAQGGRSHSWTSPNSYLPLLGSNRWQVGVGEVFHPQSASCFSLPSSQGLEQHHESEPLEYQAPHRRVHSYPGPTSQGHESSLTPASDLPPFPSFSTTKMAIPPHHSFQAPVMDTRSLDSCTSSSAANAPGDTNGLCQPQTVLNQSLRTSGSSVPINFVPEDDQSIQNLPPLAAATSGLRSFVAAPPHPTSTSSKPHLSLTSDISSRSSSLQSLSHQLEDPMASILSRAGQTSASKAFLSSPERVGRRSRCSENDEDGAVEEKDRIALIRLARQQASAEGGSSHLKRLRTRSESPANSPVAVPTLAHEASPSPLEPVGVFASPPQTPLFVHPWVLKWSGGTHEGDAGARENINDDAPRGSDLKERPLTTPISPRGRRFETDQLGPDQSGPCSPCHMRESDGHAVTSGRFLNEHFMQHHATSELGHSQDLDSSPLSSPAPSEVSDTPSPLLKPRISLAPSRVVATQLDDLKSEWTSNRWLFGPFLPGEAVTDSVNQRQNLCPRLNPPQLIHSKEAQAWIAYRRNYFGLNIAMKLPSAHASLYVLGVPVRRFFTMVKARNIKSDVPSKTLWRSHWSPSPVLDFVSILQFDGTRKLAQATELEPHGFLPSNSDPHARELVSAYSRVQFRNATANHILGSVNANGIGKAVRFIVLLLAELEDGRQVEVGRWESDEIIVRGRCPKNFAKSGGSRKGRKGSRKRASVHDDADDELESSSVDEEESTVPARRGTRSRPSSGRHLDAQLAQASTSRAPRQRATASVSNKRKKM
ncbi:BQ2448_2479 [Microbotryum intermedium]|uniref:BQ2448_2479 protein n=1 Tax=Microbotryum intermedium TaxID=269621 RepID=A0A238F9N4_9BASI|nr:BQ2448_2479 [Microbotryum intermedium]